MLRKLMIQLVKILGKTAKGIWDTSIISSIKPKSDYQFFGDLHVLYTLWTQNFSASSANQSKNNSKFANLKKHMNCQRIISTFGLIDSDWSVLYSFSCKNKTVCCKRRPKIVPDQLLVWGIRALWRFWMVPNWS